MWNNVMIKSIVTLCEMIKKHTRYRVSIRGATLPESQCSSGERRIHDEARKRGNSMVLIHEVRARASRGLKIYMMRAAVA